MTNLRDLVKNAIILTNYEKNLLINKNVSPPKLYGLAKVHKTGIPIRPVVSYKSAPAYKLAKKSNQLYLDMSKYKNPYSINNSLEVIEKIKDMYIPPSAKILSFDVVNLFPSIPVPELKQVIEENLGRISDENPILKKELLDFMFLCLDQNYFSFKDKIYLQKDGLPMGSPLSPLCADLFMHFLEKKIFNDSLNPFKRKIGYWFRYVDDILCLFSGTDEELVAFHEFLNTLHDRIKFTMECLDGGTFINFLDLTISIKHNQHSFKIFHKPSSTDVVIPMSSIHSMNHKRSAFNFYFDRLLRTPQCQTDFKIELDRICRIGLNNGYSLKWILDVFEDRKKDVVRTLIYPVIDSNNHCKSYRRLLYVGDISQKMGRLINNNTRKTAFYPIPNLGRNLINRTIPVPKMKRSGIYKLKCNDCEGVYVGQTARCFETRIKEHVASFRKQDDKSNFAQHLVEENHTFNKETGIELLHFCEGGKRMDILESLEIRKAIKEGNILNAQLDVKNSPIINFLVSLTLAPSVATSLDSANSA
ncbi:hypothetical protein WDU94_008907 [Cyamophila willieti]